MEKSIGQPKKVKTKSGRAGSFFLGTFIGFLLTLALLAGLFSFVYFKVSAKWVNKTFKTNINLPYDLDDMTLSDLVSGAINLGKNLDNYTLEDLKNDFGINVPDELFKIDISDLKIVTFSELKDKLTEKFENISAKELEGVISLGNVEDFLTDPKHANTYYVQGTTLFTDADHQTPVTDFNYKIVENKVQIKNIYTSDPITDGKVSIELYYLPIKVAFSSLNFSENMKIEELEKYVELPDFLNKIDKTKPIKDLDEEIDKLQIADILGYYIDPDTNEVYKDDTRAEKVSKLESTLAKETISSLKTGLNFKLGDIFEDKYFEQGQLLYLLSDDTSKATTVDKLPNLLDQKIKTASLNTLKDLGFFSEQEFSEGILSLVPEDERDTCTLTTLPDTLQKSVGSASMGELKDLHILNTGLDLTSQTIEVERDGKMEDKLLKDVTFSEFLNAVLSGKYPKPVTQ